GAGHPRRVLVPRRGAPGRPRQPAALRDEGPQNLTHNCPGAKTTRRTDMKRPWESSRRYGAGSLAGWALALGFLLFAPCLCGSLHANDWPAMRGPEQNGVARDKNLPETFSPDPND